MSKKIGDIEKDLNTLKTDLEATGMESMEILENKDENTLTIGFDTSKIRKVFKLKLCKPDAHNYNTLYEYAKFIIEDSKNERKIDITKFKIGLSFGALFLNAAASYTLCKDISTELSIVGFALSAIAVKNICTLDHLIQRGDEIEQHKLGYLTEVEEKVTEYKK